MDQETPIVNSAVTIPNIISMVRILATPLFIIFLLQNDYGKAMAVFVLAGLSDLVDGYIARNFKQKSPLGAFLDPLADKLLMTASYLTLGYFEKIPAWLTVVVISRDVVIIGGVIILKLFEIEFRIKPARVSKWATATQIITVFLALLQELIPLHPWVLLASCWLTTYFTVASGLVYLNKGMRLLNGSPT
ncbi:MAG: CDP-diacylglycerol--glycerol-3-phosphate 3-phosphatidyltransferase [Deltaproteobacteria bacterium]|nr:CDP-diacylglycerol--glycerol-3-phosphate 3-phosphatidyltransferase [Deltaproteobacteria bacterium]